LSALDGRTVALVRVATAIARGADDGGLADRMRAARAAGVPPQWMEELLLQSLLNVGYPLALVAFGVWRDVVGPEGSTGGGTGGGTGDPSEPVQHADWRVWMTRGEEACRAVYGRTYHKLMINLENLHPALPSLVLIDAYGKLLGRPALDAKRRELCTVAAIAMLNAPKQLHAHLRGAMNTGCTREEVDEVLALVEGDSTPERALKMWEAWADVRERAL
jgi:4-carboxymuconolactone decarboxylase